MSPRALPVSSSRIERSNDVWLEALCAAVPDAAVVEDLGGLVRGALHKALAARALDASTLDDLAQVAVVQVLAKLEHFEGRSRFTTWAYSVAVRAALTELRRPLYRTGSGNEAELESVADGDAGPVAAAEQGEIVAVLYRVIEDELTEHQRAAVMGELAGKPQDELLSDLGINRNALYKLQHDARRKLRAGLGAAGFCDIAVRESLGLASKES